jgi:hypothetical protein
VQWIVSRLLRSDALRQLAQRAQLRFRLADVERLGDALHQLLAFVARA